MNDRSETLVHRATKLYEQRYGQSPQWIAAAPGRVNIIGEHIDYNDGFVLPMGIERYCVIAAGQADDDSSSAAEFYSAATNDDVRISLNAPSRHAEQGHWSNYVGGVVAGCAQRGWRLPNFRAVVESSVPVGGGLSSSAALEVSTATLLEAITGNSLEPVEKALLCQKAEHEFAGVPCGIMDQFASVMCRADHLMLLDCRSRQIEHIPFTDPQVTVLIINTNVKHELSGGEYAERRAQCEAAAHALGLASLRDASLEQLELERERVNEVEFRRARHATSEIERTTSAAAAIKAGDWNEVGRLMYASHNSLRDDYEVSCPELDLLVDLAREVGKSGGVIGSRMTGGGFGGCTVTLAETGKVDAIAQALADSYQSRTGIEPSIITSRPARGAHVVGII